MQGVRKHSNPITGKVLQRNGARTMYVGDKLIVIMIDYIYKCGMSVTANKLEAYRCAIGITFSKHAVANSSSRYNHGWSDTVANFKYASIVPPPS